MQTVVAFRRAAFVLLQGAPGTFEYPGDSGEPVERWFCRDCGAPLCGRPASSPDLIFVSVPALDDDAGVIPQMHIYTSRRSAWDLCRDDLPEFAELPPAPSA